MSALCGWCRKKTGAPIAVGIVAQDTRSGATTYACPGCRKANRLVPMSQWKHPGDGRPQHYPVPTPQ